MKTNQILIIAALEEALESITSSLKSSNMLIDKYNTEKIENSFFL